VSSEASIGPDGEVVVECGLDAPPEKVWRALSIPELAADWLRARPEGATGPEPSFEIVAAEPFSRLTYRWRDRAEPMPGDSFVTVELRPDGTGATWFRLTHSPPRARLTAANGNAPVALAA
jgi:uncharacterized protein YndB with AHSA1/START domain